MKNTMNERYKKEIVIALSDRLEKLWDLSDKYSKEGETDKYNECYDEIYLIKEIANEYHIDFDDRIASRF